MVASGKQLKYLPVTREAEDENGNVVGRYRVIASGPFPATCDCTFDSSTNSKLAEACIVGGVLWKLQQFCRRGQNQAKFWRTHGILLGVYVFLILCLGTLLDGTQQQDEETSHNKQDDLTLQQNRLWVGVGLLVVTALYFLVLVFLGAKLGISPTFRTKLEALIQEISDELEPIGLVVSLDDSSSSFLTRSSNMTIVLKEKHPSQPVQRLPLVRPKAARDQQHTKETTTASVDSILYYGGHSPSLSHRASQYDPLPVDDWIAGGLMMRLRRDRFRASQCSRWLAFLLIIPIGVISILHLTIHGSDSDNDNTSTNLHDTLMALAIGGILTMAYWYLRELLDASAIHSVSRAVVKQFSALAKERHDLALAYEVQPGDFLPRITKGVIRFQPSDSSSDVSDVKKKAKATLAFV